jgi:chromosome segregation ATPase
MIEIAAAINGFAPGGQVSPPEDQLITLTLGQLRELIHGAVQKAAEPIFQELEALRGEIFELRSRQTALETRISGREVPQDTQEEMLTLKTTIEARDEEIRALKSELETLEGSVARERAYDRQRIARLENPPDEPTPSEKDHIDRVEKLLRNNPRHAMSFAELRGCLNLSAGRVSQIVKKLDPAKFEIRKGSNHKARILVLRPRHFN